MWDYWYLITCVIAQSNPRRLLPIWREKLRGHYHVTMTSDNDFCVWRWHYRECHSRVSINAQTITRNARRIRALIISRNDRHVWTDWNSFTGMSTEMIKMLFSSCFCQKNTHKTHKIVQVTVINDNNNQCCSRGHDCRGQGQGQGHSLRVQGQGQGQSIRGRGQGQGLASEAEAKAKASTEFLNHKITYF